MLSAAEAHGGPALTAVACVGSRAGSLGQESQRHEPSPEPNRGRGARADPTHMLHGKTSSAGHPLPEAR